MRNRTLHSLLEAFVVDAAAELSAQAAAGAEIPFELREEPGGGRVPLYCYRPLTGIFIRERLGLLSGLTSYAPVARALAATDGVERYLRERGEPRIPSEPRERADAVLRSFLSQVYRERSEFAFDPQRFDFAYGELERALYDGQCVTTVLAPLLGVDIESDEIPLGDGLSLMAGEAFEDAPADAIWGEGDDANVLIVLTALDARTGRPPVSVARVRFRRILSALRLFEPGSYALGPLGWTRVDAGEWRPVGLGSSGRARLPTLVRAEQEDELRAFCNLIPRRAGSSGELGWALSRFEMGCERLAPFEALSDYLLALRALLEPEGPSSGRLAGRLAAICAVPDDRAALAERIAHAISLERAVIAGLAPAEPGVDALVGEVADHLRAILRDALCGHLDHDLRGVADGLISEAAHAAR